jgi:hypothetical protein
MKHLHAVLLLTTTLLLDACGNSKAPEAPVVDAQPPAAELAAAKPKLKGCDLITAEEMSQLLGAAVVPTADEGGGRTGCNWAPAAGGMPFAELKVEWGMAEAAMQAAGMLSKHEPGINDPYDDLGDEAWITGPMVMVKRNEDLITLMVYGPGDTEAAIHKMYETATSRL